MARPGPIDYDSLPTDPLERRLILERRAEPDEDRPRLPSDVERRLAPLEEEMAQCYLEHEELIYRLKALRKRLANGIIPGPRLERAGSEA
jgi:hypothetical protein